ncbi:response regulator [Marinomonas ostreistagni]|uniref:response regulator n=1 Tax=Marinomonas ostreistagni TaxID=359209 RepID=UPI001950F9A8|nr:two-component system response regulator [Marinomonas ostreistagni]MBM6551735.1 two-component system response regulator [Marinomonas ostreistagni]
MNEVAQKTILVVDDEPVNITVMSGILRNDYRVLIAKNGYQALERISNSGLPDLILLDIMMPDMDGYELCEKLKAEPETQSIPVVFVSAMSEHIDEERGLSLGAVDYITKPISPAIVLARVHNILALQDAQRALLEQNEQLEETVAQRTKEVHLTQNVTIHALASLAETRDNETGNHIRRTQFYVKLLAEELLRQGHYLDQLNAKNIDLLFRSAPLHDIGKVGIPDKILLKPGRLTPEEFEIMKDHAPLGAQALIAAEQEVGEKESSFLRFARDIAEAHHEKWDGTGYPKGLKGEDIPLSGRIMALADVYDALISERIYKPAFPHEKAKSIILEGNGSHFDPKIVAAFISVEQGFIDTAKKYQD